MKKLFLFATIAAAGLFASCSSSDDAISDAPNNPIEGNDGRQAIKIGISNTVNMATRGTGTVGGVENNATIDNVWAGQRINAFMFTQLYTPANAGDPNADPVVPPTPESWTPTLNLTKVNDIPLYDNQVMITPGTKMNLIDEMSINTASGEAMIADGTINYYPVEGRYDFFGYHGDDAVNPNDGIKKTDTRWDVPFEIDGSQDLMSTKAVLTAEQAGIMAGKTDKNNYYSAYSARQSVQPTLTFSHLLTRLAFKVKAGNVNASGYENEVTAQDAIDHNEALNGALRITAPRTEAYSFTINAPGFQTAGIVKKVGTATVGNNQYTVVEVVKNGPANPLANPDPVALSFVGQKLAVEGTDLNNVTPPLDIYAVSGDDPYTVGSSIGMSIATIAETSNDDRAAFNATLPGAITAHAAGQNLAKAVKVTKIEVKSKNTGDMAVAWTEDPTGYTYEMSPITAADWATIGANQSNWTTAIHADPHDNSSAITGYEWTGGTVDHAAYLAMTTTERAYATVATGALSDANKIAWNAGTEWLSLQERLYAKLRDGQTPEDADVEGYAEAKAAIDPAGNLAQNLSDANADYEAKNTAVTNADPSDANYDNLVTARDNAQLVKGWAQTAWDNAVALEASLRPDDLMQAMISKTVYDKLTAAGKAKYDPTAKELLNEKLIPLHPTAPSTNLAETTNVGEALIVAPKTEADPGTQEIAYDMKVTIEQDVPTSWNNPTAYSTKTIEYPLTIKAPAGGFKVNYSYNVILTVYGLERIEVITVITPWEDTHNPIVIGADN